ncbi:MAG: hypothetical protein CSA22_03970 [Deltaproteobacteria bacterium]|nr:MAG: hypothetical protein CSA22_03970 [Deltaproteobacteria bacterium]
MISYRITSAMIGISVAVVIFFLIRKDHLHIKYAFAWLALGASIALISAFPGIIDQVGAFLGVHYPPVIIIITCIAVILVKVLVMDIQRSKHEQQIKVLASKIAILESEKPPADIS